MTMVVNNSRRTLRLGGQTLEPLALADVNMSAKDVRNHLFARSGLVEVSGAGKPGPKPKPEPEPEPEGE